MSQSGTHQTNGGGYFGNSRGRRPTRKGCPNHAVEFKRQLAAAREAAGRDCTTQALAIRAVVGTARCDAGAIAARVGRFAKCAAADRRASGRDRVGGGLDVGAAAEARAALPTRATLVPCVATARDDRARAVELQLPGLWRRDAPAR